MAEPKETVIILDHDEGTIRVDTRSDLYAGMARRAGLKELTSKRSAPYMRFVGALASVNLRIRRKRVADDETKARLRLQFGAKTDQDSTLTAWKVSG